MGEDSTIEWTRHTFNPWEGCTKVSPGCLHCYAETQNHRWGKDNWGPGKTRRRTSESNWKEPIKWDKAAAAAGERHRVFCASLADVFDAEAPPGALDDLWRLIRATPNLDWLLLTKRTDRIVTNLPLDWGKGYPNVWLGTSIENQEWAEKRIPILTSIPAKVRFLSCEPLIGPLSKMPALLHPKQAFYDALTGVCSNVLDEPLARTKHPEGPAVQWVICGGESGPGARVFDVDWARRLRDDCAEVGAAFFMKQVGTVAATASKKGGTAADIPADLLVRDMPLW